MPGFEINAVPGRNFHRSMLEWNLPPLRFKSVGTPGFYLSWVRPAIFATTLTTDFDDSELRDEVSNVGIQIDLRFTVMSRFSMTLSAGYARGYGNSLIADDEEYMLFLKIL